MRWLGGFESVDTAAQMQRRPRYMQQTKGAADWYATPNWATGPTPQTEPREGTHLSGLSRRSKAAQLHQ